MNIDANIVEIYYFVDDFVKAQIQLTSAIF